MTDSNGAASLTSVPPAALWLGFAGLIPFAGLSLAIWLLPEHGPAASGLLTGYGVAILSFMGGCRWGFAAAGLGDGPSFTPLALSVLPALFAWLVALADPATAQGLLSVGFVMLLIADLTLTRQGGAPSWWPRLRWPLSLGAAACLGIGALGA